MVVSMVVVCIDARMVVVCIDVRMLLAICMDGGKDGGGLYGRDIGCMHRQYLLRNDGLIISAHFLILLKFCILTMYSPFSLFFLLLLFCFCEVFYCCCCFEVEPCYIALDSLAHIVYSSLSSNMAQI